MTISRIATALATAGLLAGLAFSAAPASAANSCETALDVGCNMPAGAFFHQDSAMGQMRQQQKLAAHRVVRRGNNEVRALAAPMLQRDGADTSICDSYSGGGSGLPADLYGKCQ